MFFNNRHHIYKGYTIYGITVFGALAGALKDHGANGVLGAALGVMAAFLVFLRTWLRTSLTLSDQGGPFCHTLHRVQNWPKWQDENALIN